MTRKLSVIYMCNRIPIYLALMGGNHENWFESRIFVPKYVRMISITNHEQESFQIRRNQELRHSTLKLQFWIFELHTSLNVLFIVERDLLLRVEVRIMWFELRTVLKNISVIRIRAHYWFSATCVHLSFLRKSITQL